MKIYVLKYHSGESYDYWDMVIGVFDSREKAEKAKEDAMEILIDAYDEPSKDQGFDIEEYECNVLNKEFV